MPTSLEICVDTIDCAATASAAGAARLELCAALSEGGLTPSLGLMQAAAALPVDIYAMIRPRAGGFVYSAAELAVMKADILAAKQMGLAGVVFGVLAPDGTLDMAANAGLMAAASGLNCTLHRAFDEVVDPFSALERAIELGFERILTSGQQASAFQGMDLIAKLVTAANGRISIMPGAGVTPDNAAQIIATTGVNEIHGSCSKTVFGTGMFAAQARRVTSKTTITNMLDVLK